MSEENEDMLVYMRHWPSEPGGAPVSIGFRNRRIVFGYLRSSFGYVYLFDGTNAEHLRKGRGPEFTIVKRRSFRTGMPPTITGRQIGSKTLRSYFYLGEWKKVDGKTYVDAAAWKFIEKYNVRPGRHLRSITDMPKPNSGRYVGNITVQELLEAYKAGRRNFRSAQLPENGILGNPESEERIDLSGADFGDAHFHNGAFRNVILRGATFYAANLEGCTFHGVDLEGAVFDGASLRKARFEETNLNGACMNNADLYAAKFRNNDMDNIDFVGANLYRADFYACDTTGANFSGAYLRNTEMDMGLHKALFVGAHIYAAEFGNGKLTNCSFVDAYLRDAAFPNDTAGSQFTRAHLHDCFFLNVELADADFTHTHLNGTLFENCDLSAVKGDLSGGQFVECTLSPRIAEAERRAEIDDRARRGEMKKKFKREYLVEELELPYERDTDISVSG